MQLAVGQLAPSLDPFALASKFLVNNTRRQALEQLDPQRLYYNSQKLMLADLAHRRGARARERRPPGRPGSPGDRVGDARA